MGEFSWLLCYNVGFSVFCQIKEALIHELSEKFSKEIDLLRREVRVSVVINHFYSACLKCISSEKFNLRIISLHSVQDLTWPIYWSM